MVLNCDDGTLKEDMAMPLGMPEDTVWLDAEAQTSEPSIWTWKMSNSETLYVSETIVFCWPLDADWTDDFARYERLAP